MDISIVLTFKEINAFIFEVLGFAVFVGGKNSSLIVFVEGDIHIYLAWFHLFKC